MNIDNNIMRDMSEIGMYVTQCGAGVDDVDIVNNKIYKTPYGIFCYDNPDAELKIEDNEISYVGMASPTDTMTGIFVVEITPGDISDPNTVSIHDNRIYKTPSGIHTMNLFGSLPSGGTGTLYIGENEVSILQPSSTGTHHSGIYMQNHTLALVAENVITQHYGSANWWEKGITSGSGVANQFLCNDVQKIGTAFTFFNDQRPLTTFAKNVMGDNSRGLLLNHGIIGQQGGPDDPYDNEWNGTGWSSGNPNTETYGSGTNGSLSKFYVRNSIPSIYYPQYNVNNAGATFPVSVQDTTGSWTNGCLYSAPSFKTGADEVAGLSDGLSIVSSTEEEVETERERGMRWAGQYGLYKVLLMNEELRYADNGLASFFAEKDIGTMGSLHRSLVGWQATRSGQGLSVSASGQALAALQPLEPDGLPEQRLKETLIILYSNTTDLRAMNETHEAQLRELAQLCPIDNGFAVYIARAALLKVDTLPRLYTSDCERTPAPTLQEEWKLEDAPASEAHDFSIYPNPSNGRFTLNYVLNEGEFGTVSIHSLIGDLVLQRTLAPTANTMEMYMENVAEGLYLMNVDVNGRRMLSEKVSIFNR